LTNKVSIKSILRSQAELEFTDDQDREISEILIDYIDENGWILEKIEDISDFSGFKIADIEKVLGIMQTFEPNGVFARNLKECLKIQLRNDNLLDDEKETIINNLELLGSGELKALQKLTNLKEESLKSHIRLIRSLDPKPGRKFDNEQDNISYPDVIVSKNNQDWTVELNEGTLPKITVNESYAKEVAKLECKDSDKKFISESLNSARWLLKAIQQRNITTLKISSEIVNQQKLFFEKGKKFLKPMVLKDVAKKIDMHESTVSRVTSDKLMLTPRGIFEMKLFFSASNTKNNFISKIPLGVNISLSDVTRLTVLSCISIFFATSFKTIGFKNFFPFSKNNFC
jgi:RNA polymerase sigma-54 factor